MNDLRDYIENIKEEVFAIYDGKAMNEEEEPASFYDYFEDALDWNYTISANGDFLGVRVYVTLGGPNVWIDTRNKEIAGAWGTERESTWLPSEICEEIDEVFESYYESIA